MAAAQASARDVQQLCRLRGLRVQAARAQCQAARERLEVAAQAVRLRQQRIAQHQQRPARLALALVGELAPQLPRCAEVAQAQRERLDDLLERDRYALIDDEHSLEQSQEALARCLSALSRALAAEDAVQDLARRCRLAQAQQRDQRAERELDERRLPPA